MVRQREALVLAIFHLFCKAPQVKKRLFPTKPLPLSKPLNFVQFCRAQRSRSTKNRKRHRAQFIWIAEPNADIDFDDFKIFFYSGLFRLHGCMIFHLRPQAVHRWFSSTGQKRAKF